MAHDWRIFGCAGPICGNKRVELRIYTYRHFWSDVVAIGHSRVGETHMHKLHNLHNGTG